MYSICVSELGSKIDPGILLLENIDVRKCAERYTVRKQQY